MLITELNHVVAKRRLSAINDLGSSGDHRAPGPLARRLFDMDVEIRNRAAFVLADYGLGDAADAVCDLYSGGAEARFSAIRTLGALICKPMPAPHVAVIAVTAAGLHELFDEVAVAGITHHDHFVRRAAIEGLYQVNQPSLAPVFLIPSSDADPGVRRYSAVGLAENNVLVGARRLCYDLDKNVAKAARTAFARPGSPTLIRDPHRRVMNESQSFHLPDCGSPTMTTRRFPRLSEVAQNLLKEDHLIRAEMSAVTLLLLGRSREDIRALLSDDAHPALLRRVRSPNPIAKSKEANPIDPELMGKRVLLVGGDGVEGPIVKVLCATGLDVVWMSGFDNEIAHLKDAVFDAILVLTKRVSHAGAKHAVRIGEKGGSVVVHVNTLGQDSIIDAARDALV